MNGIKKLAYGFTMSVSLAFFITSAFAVDYVWNGTNNGAWEDSANWIPNTGFPSTPEDTATINNPLNKEGEGSSFQVTVTNPLNIASMTIGGVEGNEGKVTLLFSTFLATNKISGNVTIGSNAILTHFGPNTTITNNLCLQVGGDMTIAAAGKIDVSKKGYAFIPNGGSSNFQYGPGASRDNGIYGGEVDTSWPRGVVHGSVRRPIHYGGPATNSGVESPGAIRLIVAGVLRVDGEISSCGSIAYVCGSSGGSIWIDCASLVGSGKIAASAGTTTEKYIGSGGRIAIYQKESSDISGFTGVCTTANSTSVGSTCGTIYLECNGDKIGEGTLIIDNAGKDVSFRTPLNFVMTDSTNAFGRIVVRNRGKMRVVSGMVLKVSKGISVDANSSILAESGAVIEFTGEDEALLTGMSRVTCDTIVCTNAGKTIRFGTDNALDRFSIPLGKNLIIKGSEEKPIILASQTDGVPWHFCLDPNVALADISNVSVRDSDASHGAGIFALNSTDLGNNRYWGFSAPVLPGATITWTGKEDAAWQNTANWSPARAPLATDNIVIPSVETGLYPVLGSGTFVFNKVSVEEGASWTVSGATITFTNKVSVAGTLAFNGGENITFLKDLVFSGAGKCIPASSKFIFAGEGDQLLDFNDTSVCNLSFEKISGNVSFGANGFTAGRMSCAATVPIDFTFAAGELYSITNLQLSGLVSSVSSLKLKSSVPGTPWRLSAIADNVVVSGVTVSDSDASAGDTIMAGTASVDDKNNINWDFDTELASWIGDAAGSFDEPSNWSINKVPDAKTIVTIQAGENQSVVITLPADSPISVKSLSIFAGAGGSAKLVADSPLTVCDSLDIKENGIVELNAFNENEEAPNIVTNSVRIRSGGVLSHSGPNATEVKKLHVRCLGDFTVEAGGAVNVDYKGYTYNEGPGCANRTPLYASTASHWAGALGTAKCYGSIRKPFNYGSGCSGQASGGAGSGAVRLEVLGRLTVDGKITSSTMDTRGVFRAAAGSVWIDCGVLSGTGNILAHGAKWPDYGEISTSGGRIAVYQSQTNDLTSFTGKIQTTRTTCKYSACGTIYLEDTDDAKGEGTLLIDNLGVNSGNFVTVFGELMTDVDEPFGEVVLQNYAKLKVYPGKTLKVKRGIRCSSNSTLLTADSTAVIELCGTNDMQIIGASRISTHNFVCTNIEKRVFFESGANGMLSMGANTSLKLSGLDVEHPLSLLPLSEGQTWQLKVDAYAQADVKHVAVKNSDASQGSTILAYESINLEGNKAWSIMDKINPGDKIVWTGSVSSDWADIGNWDRNRVPLESDDIIIKPAGEFNPVIGEGEYVFHRIEINPGASLTLSETMLTVTNELCNSGSLIFSGSEHLYLTGDAFFTNGTVEASSSVIWISGERNQTIDFSDTVLSKVYITKTSGIVDFSGHGFTASYINAMPNYPMNVTFAAGKLYSFGECYFVGNSDVGKMSLLSSDPSKQWRVKLTQLQSFANLYVNGCDASDGEVACYGDTSMDGGNNKDCDFEAKTAMWTGGSAGEFFIPENWSTKVVPSADTRATVIAGESENITVTVPAGNPITIKSLVLAAGAGGNANFNAKSPLTVSEYAYVCSGGILTLDVYNDSGEAPNVVSNDVVVYSGGKITHSGNKSTENAKLHLAVLGDMTVHEGGEVTATKKGYAKTTCPHGTIPMGSSASHAGYGKQNHAPYGSIFRPVSWGGGTSDEPGGGAIHLIVSGNITVNGTIEAEGGGNNIYYSGAGGSIWLECASLMGSGLVSARQGLNRFDPSYTSSGGRVAVYQRTAKDFSAFPKSRILATRNKVAACGTVYLESASSSVAGADLYIETDTSTNYSTQFPMDEDGDASTCYANVNLIIGKGGKVVVPRGADDKPREIRLRSLMLSSSNSTLNLGVNTFIVTDPSWRRDKDWVSRSVTVDLYNKVPGKIVYLSRGTMIFIR